MLLTKILPPELEPTEYGRPARNPAPSTPIPETGLAAQTPFIVSANQVKLTRT